MTSGTTFANAALPTNLWVEGTAPSAAAGDVVFRLNPVGIDCPQAGVGCDRAVMTAVKVDLDIDSDHTNGDFGGPDRDGFEESIEEVSPGPTPHQAHKYVLVNTCHAKGGYLPGYANFAGVSESAPNTISFTPITLELLPYDALQEHLEGATITLAYSCSDPSPITSNRLERGVWEWQRPEGMLRIWTKDISATRNPASIMAGGDFIPADAAIPLTKLDFTAPITLYVEAIRPATSLGTTSIEVEVNLSGIAGGAILNDKIHCTPIEVNVAVDNFNDSGYDTPVHESAAEDHYEDYIDGTNHIGRIVVVNDGDTDLDGIPGFADGYGLFDLPEYQVSTNSQFVPVIFELPKPIDFERASVKLTYDASDPLGVTTNSTGEHLLPESGRLRLWIKDGGEPRGGKAVIDGGDFLSAGEYSAIQFGFSNENNRVLTYYIETVKPSEEVGDMRILFEVQPDERTGFMAADAVRVTSLQMQFIIPDADGGKRPTLFVPVSDPCPVVTLDALLPEDVTIAGDTATFKVSGAVADALADIMPDNLADIASVRLLIDDEEHIAPTALAAGDGGASTFWRRHPFRGVFNGLQVSLPSRGSHIVTVETAENAAGRKGWQSLALNFHSAAEEFFGGTNFMANIHIATNLTDTVADTIQFFHGDGGPYEDDPRLAETGAATLVFTGRLDEAGVEVSIGAFSGLSTNVDSFVAELRYNLSTNCQPVYSNLFVETSATSGLFRSISAFTVARGDLTVGVVALGGTLPGICVPTVERVKGPADLLGNGDCTLTFMGADYALEEEAGWFYPQGGSPRFSIPVPDPDDPSAGKIITFEKKNGVLNKYGIQNWALSSTLFWCNLEIYDIKVQVVMIQSVRLPEAPSDGLVVKQGSNVVMLATILPISFSPPENEPKWYYQRLKSGGTWEEWASFGEKASGVAYTNKTELSGVFRVKTVLSINGAFLCEKIYARTADEPWGYEKAGEPDAFGVVDTDFQIALRNSAKSWLGKTKYAQGIKLDAEMGFPARPNPSNKCNLFVAHRAHESGAVVPLIGGGRRKDPPSANQWAGQDNTRPWIPWGHSIYIKNWTLLLHPTYPQPGFIVAYPRTGRSGHVGIVDYNGKGIAAGEYKVNKISEEFSGASENSVGFFITQDTGSTLRDGTSHRF